MHGPLIICSSEPWLPAIGRTHALAALAAESGARVIFLERPRDVRAVTHPAARAAWWQALKAASVASRFERIEVRSWSTLVPGHRAAWCQLIESALLRRAFADLGAARASVVATTPWQWPGVSRVPAARRVFDCGDDWAAILPHRARAFRNIYWRIAREADAIVIASETMAPMFPSNALVVVRNGVGDDLLGAPLTPPTDPRTLVYAGTLSERFDATLVSKLLVTLPGWRIQLYGPCRYRLCGELPGPELLELLRSSEGRVQWLGTVSRVDLAEALDAGAVMIAPLRRCGAVTGDPMKFYDYAARGRPIVTTRWRDDLIACGPPHLYEATTAEEFAAAAVHAASETADYAEQRRAWAEQNHWRGRWRVWAAALFGE